MIKLNLDEYSLKTNKALIKINQIINDTLFRFFILTFFLAKNKIVYPRSSNNK